MALGAISTVLVGVAGRLLPCSSPFAAFEPDLFPIRSPFNLAVRKYRGSDTHHVRLEGELVFRIFTFLFPSLYMIFLRIFTAEVFDLVFRRPSFRNTIAD